MHKLSTEYYYLFIVLSIYGIIIYGTIYAYKNHELKYLLLVVRDTPASPYSYGILVHLNSCQILNIILPI